MGAFIVVLILVIGAYLLGIGVSRRSFAAAEPVEADKSGVELAEERQEGERRTLELGSNHGTAELAHQSEPVEMSVLR